MPGRACAQCALRFYWTPDYVGDICPACKLRSLVKGKSGMPINPEQWLPPAGPLFHVRFIENGVEQEQVFIGVPDENGGFNINVPTPCTLLSVKQHGFPFCEVCDVAPNMELLPRRFETESAKGTPIDTSRFFKSKAEHESELIHAEVEAMDWPEVIGE